ncbi:MAG: DUF192 domain-containing protein [Dehalococcoides mccartyi]|uniref:DUF192 domain-containing protein n=1 Tax=Dehalococcoides mccartyi TaxID=61435 RepID=UPI0030FAB583|nr:DUF192 domain-containing protein [Dehalococcoidales bacterium]
MLFGTIAVKNKQWNINIATTPWELTQGLGGLSDMPIQEGMLFDLGWSQTIQVTTVPMLFPLDIAFFSETLEITEIYRNIQPGYLVTSTSLARYFLEVNAGELEGVESEDQATVELLSTQELVTTPDWMSAVIGFMGFAVMGIFTISIIRDLVKGLFGEQKQPELLPQTRLIGKFTLRMDRIGNIIITHNKRPGQSVFLQFESDKELVFDLLKKPERKDLEAGWNIEIKDTEPRASILNELWEVSGQENGSQPAVVLVKATCLKEPSLNYLTDSPEYLTWTIEDIGYREKIDNAFLEAIARARSKK